MTFVSDRLQELIDEENSKDGYFLYKGPYLDGLERAKQEVIRAEAELERRIWQAWVNEGVEPK